MQKLGVLLKMGFIKLTATIDSSRKEFYQMEASPLSKTELQAGMAGRAGEFQLPLSRAVIPPHSSLEELIQTQHILAGVKKSKQPPNFSFKNAFQTKSSGIFP